MARVIAIGSFGLLGIALITNVVSLITGIVAWTKGGGRCPWILASALVLAAPLVLWIAVKLNI